MSFDYALVDNREPPRVVHLRQVLGNLIADGLRPVLLAESVEGWPEAPDESCELIVEDGQLAWLDTRTEAERASAVRAQRDQRLAATDWVVTRAMERAEPVPSAWAMYRQALRDIPLQPGFPGAVNWPAEPTN